MESDKNIIKDYFQSITPSHNVEDTTFLRIMNRVEHQSQCNKKRSVLWRFAIPSLLVFVFIASSVFPVFGSEKGSLVDIYNSYKVARTLSDLNTAPIKNLPDESISDYLYTSLLEEQYGIDPVEFLEMIYVHNISQSEAIFMLLLAKEKNIPVEDIIRLKKNRMNWGVLVKRFNVAPNMCVHYMHEFQDLFNSVPSEGFIVDGKVTNINTLEGSIFIDHFPYPIFANNIPAAMSELFVSCPIHTKVQFNPTRNRFELQSYDIKPLKPTRPVTFIGYIISLSSDTLILGSKNSKRLVLKIPPHFYNTLIQNVNVKKGALIKITSFSDRNGENQAIRYSILNEEMYETMKKVQSSFSNPPGITTRCIPPIVEGLPSQKQARPSQEEIEQRRKLQQKWIESQKAKKVQSNNN